MTEMFTILSTYDAWKITMVSLNVAGLYVIWMFIRALALKGE